MSSVAAVILAHQGGWDEMLLVAAPIAVIVLLLRLANRRADKQVRARDAAASGASNSAEGSRPPGTPQTPDV